MIQTVIIILVLAGLIYWQIRMLGKYDWYDCVWMDIINPLLIIIVSVIAIIHFTEVFIASYNYEKWVYEREAFIETIEYSRDNQDRFEKAAITKEIAEWNKELAAAKYKNKTLYFDVYYDDRVDELEYIK